MDLLFYDGDCGMCHGTVRFIAARDRHDAFRYAPLGGATFQEKVPADRQAGLPDSIVLLTARGDLLTKSSAVVYALRKLGGAWNAIGLAIEVIPRTLRDFFYDLVARIRYKLFPKPSGACPMLPSHLRARFDP